MDGNEVSKDTFSLWPTRRGCGILSAKNQFLNACTKGFIDYLCASFLKTKF
jgi:hypothetical protein